MSEHDKDQQDYDAVFAAVSGQDLPASASSAVKEATPAPATPVTPAPVAAQPDEKTDTLIFGKYKTPEEAAKGFKELEKMAAPAKEFLSLESRLKNPETRQAALLELAKKYEVELPNAEAAKEDQPPARDLSKLEDGEIVTVGELREFQRQQNAQLTELLKKATEVAPDQKIVELVKPILQERRIAELKSRGGVFALYSDPEISALRDAIVKADADGTEGLDVHAHYAAIGMAIEKGGFGEALEKLVESRMNQSLKAKQQAQTETGGGTIQPKAKSKLSPEELEQKAYEDMFDAMPGR